MYHLLFMLYVNWHIIYYSVTPITLIILIVCRIIRLYWKSVITVKSSPSQFNVIFLFCFCLDITLSTISFIIIIKTRYVTDLILLICSICYVCHLLLTFVYCYSLNNMHLIPSISFAMPSSGSFLASVLCSTLPICYLLLSTHLDVIF